MDDPIADSVGAVMTEEDVIAFDCVLHECRGQQEDLENRSRFKDIDNSPVFTLCYFKSSNSWVELVVAYIKYAGLKTGRIFTFPNSLYGSPHGVGVDPEVYVVVNRGWVVVAGDVPQVSGGYRKGIWVAYRAIYAFR